MRIVLLPAAILAAMPAAAQLRSVEMSFEGINCASCLESLPARVQRVRGVESARVDSARAVLLVQLAAQNRVRIEQLRDFVQQDGTKARRAVVKARGQLVEEGGKWILKLPQGSGTWEIALDEAPPSVQYSLKAGEAVVMGKLPQLAAPWRIIPSDIRPAEE